ncbi:MAG: hypothetical protein ABIK79_08930 [Chloroflexota bacterium]
MTDSERYDTEARDAWVAGPGGVRLYMKIREPSRQKYADRRFPVVITVPGGLGSGQQGRFGMSLAELGFVHVAFCPQGRGEGTPEHPRSEGEEDCNGFAGQDGLKAAIEHVAELPEVDAECIGIFSASFGISLTAGALGRYPELPVRYVIDNEGPSDSEVICFDPWDDPEREEWAVERFGHRSTARDPSPENVAWWNEREAVRYIGKMRACYLRTQSDEDHAQPPGFCRHALDLVNRATLGASPWTRVNGSDMGNPINATYDVDDPAAHPRWLHGHLKHHRGVEVRYIVEMMELVRREKL